MLMYFIGGTPYPGVKGRDVYSLLKEGYRIEKPRHVNMYVCISVFKYPVSTRGQLFIQLNPGLVEILWTKLY